MQVKGIDHVSVIVEDTARAVHFYCDVLGLRRSDERPDLGYPGAWIALGTHQIHLLEVPNPDPVSNRPAQGGRDRHVAMIVDDLQSYLRRLQEAGTAYHLSSSGRSAAFCRDPDGNGIELIEHPAAEA